MRTAIQLPAGGMYTGLWPLLFDMADVCTGEWVLVGGQMVAVHGMCYGAYPVRPSEDLDLMVDVLLAPAALRTIAEQLVAWGYQPHKSLNPGRETVRYERNGLVVDILAPDRLPSGTDLTTTPPGGTVQTAGGAQALGRVEYITAVDQGRMGEIPVPSLLGAIGLKAAAVEHGYAYQAGIKHRIDLAFLMSLEADIDKTYAPATKQDLRRIARCSWLRDETNPVWQYLPDHAREPAIRSYVAVTRMLNG